MEKTDSLFSTEESGAITSSWATLTGGQPGEFGQLILHRLLTKVPDVRDVFKYITIDDSDPELYSLTRLKENEKFCLHALRVERGIGELVENLTRTDVLVTKCMKLGKIHIAYKVEPQHFDALGPVLVDVILSALRMNASHPTIQAWVKAYGIIADTAKKGLSG